MGKQSNQPVASSTVCRRRYLGLTTAVATGAVAGCSEPASDDDGGDDEDGESSTEAAVALNLDTRNERYVPDTLFGRFAEHYGAHEIYPGIYAEHVTNTSFVVWGQVQPDRVSHVYDFDEVGEYDDVPFPWEPLGEEVDFERHDDSGVRGLGTWESDGGWPEVGREPRNAYQRIVLENGEGGVRQRIPLPDWRTLGYECSLSARAAGIDDLEVRLTAPDGDALASGQLDGLTGEWQRFEDIELTLEEPSGSRLEAGTFGDFASPYGEYALEIVSEGTGRVDLDWISLMPDDAVNGKFNPTTVDLMDDRNVTLLK